MGFMCKLLSIYSYSTIFFQVTIFDSVNEYILLFTFLTIAVILVIIAYCITIFHWTTLVPNLTFCNLCASGIIQRLSCVVRFKASVDKLGLRGFIWGTPPLFSRLLQRQGHWRLILAWIRSPPKREIRC